MRNLLRTLVNLLILFSILGCSTTENKGFFLSGRAPANVEGCSFLTNRLMESISPQSRFDKWKSFFKKSSDSEAEFSSAESILLERSYLQKMRAGETVTPSKTPEALMAYIRASRRAIDNSSEEALEISKAQQRALEKALKRLKSGRSEFRLTDMDDLIYDLYMIAYGPRLSLRNSLNVDRFQKELVVKIAVAEIASRGLYNSFPHQRFLKANPGFLKKFIQSRFSSGLKITIFNLPMLWGAPPLYLPGLKSPKISQELANKILSSGIDEDTLRRIDLEIGSTLVMREDYERLRQYYLYGAMTYLMLLQAHETYKLEQELSETNEYLEEVNENTSEIVDNLEVLKGSSVDVYSDDEIEEGSLFCQNLMECFEAFSILPEDRNSEEFATCQSIIDPGNQCKSL